MTSAIKKVPLSDTSNIPRLQLLATDVFETLLEDLKKADFLAVDESTDKTDTAQLCIYCMSVLNGKCLLQRGTAHLTAVGLFTKF